MNLDFFAHGIPKAQPRVKAYRRGNRAGVYDPGTANDWKSIVRAAAFAEWDKKRIDGPVAVSTWFYIPRPKSHFNRHGELRADAPKWVTKKPDADNLQKAVLDALSDLGLWGDDSQVVQASAHKTYGNVSPGCHISISEL